MAPDPSGSKTRLSRDDPAAAGYSAPGATAFGHLSSDIRQVVATHFADSPAAVSDGTRLEEELGLDSAGYVELLALLEDCFGLDLIGENASALARAQTLGDLAQTVASLVDRDSGLSGTLSARLAVRAHTGAGDPALTFLDDRGNGQSLTCSELDGRARSVARLLTSAAAPGDRVLLLLPPSLAYVVGLFGCFYAGLVAVPVYPPDPRRLAGTINRLVRIAQDCQPSVVLTTAEASVLPSDAVADQMLGGASWVVIEDAPPEQGAQAALPGEIAIIQYTSGSTGQPKGVALSHQNLVSNIAGIRQQMRMSDQSKMVSWLPPYHDMGLIGGILTPIHVGYPTVLMSPLSFLSRPVRWLDAVSRHRATVSGGPNFAYDLCVRRVEQASRAALDLSPWEVAFNGADVVRAETLISFSTAFSRCGFRAQAFYPCYGLAEGSLMVSGPEPLVSPRLATIDESSGAVVPSDAPAIESANSASTLVGCGSPIHGHEMAIVEPAHRVEVPPGNVGEIWVKGPSVAVGYWGERDATGSIFGATLASGEGPFLRTGDLGSIVDGSLFVTGRIKDMIKLHGRSVSPADVEYACETASPLVRPGCTAAFSLTDQQRVDRLVIAAEVVGGPEDEPAAAFEGAIKQIRREVASAVGVQVHWIVLVGPRAIPKTSSGKLQRSLCRDRLLAGALDPIVYSWRLRAEW